MSAPNLELQGICVLSWIELGSMLPFGLSIRTLTRTYFCDARSRIIARSFSMFIITEGKYAAQTKLSECCPTLSKRYPLFANQ